MTNLKTAPFILDKLNLHTQLKYTHLGVTPVPNSTCLDPSLSSMHEVVCSNHIK